MTHALPDARVPDPKHAPPLRWGVLGTGWIAAKFTTALHRHTTQRMVAAASRDATRATAFAHQNGIERSFGSYHALVEDAEVDVVYVATPHPMHLRDATLALEAGKHVLVEKPFALDGTQARRLADVAKASGVFCMEAMWTVFLPKYDVVRQVVRSGLLGEMRTAILDHGEWFDESHRIMWPDLAGGSLLDLGTYTFVVADDLLGSGRVVGAAGDMTTTGVEGQVSGIVLHESGAQSLHHSTILTDTPIRAVIAGTEAVLELEPPFFMPGALRVRFHDGRPELTYDEPRLRHEGLFYSAVEAARRIAAGETESPLRPLEASVRTLDLLDQLRSVAGIPPPRPRDVAD
jgi:predicted dehydrogenase